MQNDRSKCVTEFSEDVSAMRSIGRKKRKIVFPKRRTNDFVNLSLLILTCSCSHKLAIHAGWVFEVY